MKTSLDEALALHKADIQAQIKQYRALCADEEKRLKPKETIIIEHIWAILCSAIVFWTIVDYFI